MTDSLATTPTLFVTLTMVPGMADRMVVGVAAGSTHTVLCCDKGEATLFSLILTLA